MVKQKVKDPEIIFYSRLHINKSGKYEEEISAKVIQRDEKGRFKSTKTVKIDPLEGLRLQKSLQTGKKSKRQVAGILKSVFDKPEQKRLSVAKDNFYSILVDNFKNVSDKQQDIIESIFNQMSTEDFKKFYEQNKELSNRVYGYGGYSERDTFYFGKTGKEVRITHAPLSPDAMGRTATEVIDRLKDFYGYTNEDLEKMIRGKYYNEYGRRIIDGRIYNWGN